MTLPSSQFGYVRDLVRRRAAIVLEPGKEYLVESRLLPLARQAGEPTVADLIGRLQKLPESGPLHAQVIDAMTTNETSWFRDRFPFDAVADTVLPQLLSARAARRSLSMWSAAASTGQEAYSLAIVVQDKLAAHPGWRAQILGTDLSDTVLAKARAGRYSQLEVNRGLPAQLLVRHFRRCGAEWTVDDQLRAMVQFAKLNLAEEFSPAVLRSLAPDGATPPFDVIFLRNVLIYFDNATKRDVLRRVRAVLAPDGYLFLGTAETTLNLDDSFERLALGRTVCYRLRSGKG